MLDIDIGFDWKVIFQKELRFKQIVVEIINPMLVAIIGDNDMETLL